jgi:hypothetical protein
MNGDRRILVAFGAAALLALAVLFFFRGERRARVESARATAPATADPAPARASARRGVSAAEARRAHDAMREQIVEALRRRTAAEQAKAPAATAATATARADAAAVEEELPVGHYDPAYIRANMHEDMFPLIQQCYGNALRRRPALAGNLVLRFSIVGDASVGGVIEDADFADESDIQDDEMRTCVRESLMTLTLDKPPEGGGKVTVTYPFAFSPDDDEDEGR